MDCVAIGSGNNCGGTDPEYLIGTGLTGAAGKIYIGTSGGYIKGTFSPPSASWGTSSDVRVKKNIERGGIGLDFINDLYPSKFQWKAPSERPEEFEGYDKDITTPSSDDTFYGFIAQDVKEALDKHDATDYTHIWSEDERDGGQWLTPGELIVPLTKAVQELSAKMDTMQTEINNLKQG